jgi:hypothetical protein
MTVLELSLLHISMTLENTPRQLCRIVHVFPSHTLMSLATPRSGILGAATATTNPNQHIPLDKDMVNLQAFLDIPVETLFSPRDERVIPINFNQRTKCHLIDNQSVQPGTLFCPGPCGILREMQ